MARGQDSFSFSFAPDTYDCAATDAAARVAAGSLLDVLSAVVSGEARNGFAAIRPPGHHCGHSGPQGFCFFNNVALACAAARRHGGVRRVLVVDWDVHHGNGTQQLVEQDQDTLFLSLHRHEHGAFFPRTGAAQETGPHGTVVNVPWSCAGLGNEEYMAAFRCAVLPLAKEFQPHLVLVSAGFDAASGDPLGGMHITPAGYHWMTQQLMTLAGGRLVLALEGGYNLPALSRCAAACIAALCGQPLPPPYRPTPTTAANAGNEAASASASTTAWAPQSAACAPSAAAAAAVTAAVTAGEPPASVATIVSRSGGDGVALAALASLAETAWQHRQRWHCMRRLSDALQWCGEAAGSGDSGNGNGSGDGSGGDGMGDGSSRSDDGSSDAAKGSGDGDATTVSQQQKGSSTAAEGGGGDNGSGVAAVLRLAALSLFHGRAPALLCRVPARAFRQRATGDGDGDGGGSGVTWDDVSVRWALVLAPPAATATATTDAATAAAPYAGAVVLLNKANRVVVDWLIPATAAAATTTTTPCPFTPSATAHGCCAAARRRTAALAAADSFALDVSRAALLRPHCRRLSPHALQFPHMRAASLFTAAWRTATQRAGSAPPPAAAAAATAVTADGSVVAQAVAAVVAAAATAGPTTTPQQQQLLLPPPASVGCHAWMAVACGGSSSKDGGRGDGSSGSVECKDDSGGDCDSGGDSEGVRVLGCHQPDLRRSVASVAKLMTAHLVLALAQRHSTSLDEVVAVSERAAATRGTTAGLKAGDCLSVRELLIGMLLPSGNDAATALAEHFGRLCAPYQHAAGTAAAQPSTTAAGKTAAAAHATADPTHESAARAGGATVSAVANASAPATDTGCAAHGNSSPACDADGSGPARPAYAITAPMFPRDYVWGWAAEDPLARFVAEMNREASRLRMTRTCYANAHGLSHTMQLSTARDTVKLVRRSLQHPELTRICALRTHRASTRSPRTVAAASLASGPAALSPRGNGIRVLRWRNTNRLLSPCEGRGAAGACFWVGGLKTGWTPHAGGCLVTTSRLAGSSGPCDSAEQRVIVVNLGSRNKNLRFVDNQRLMAWAWACLLPHEI